MRIRCGSCQTELLIADELAGRTVQCGACRTPIAVPAGDPLASLGSSPAATHRAEHRDRRRGSSVARTTATGFFVVLDLLISIPLLLAASLLWSMSMLVGWGGLPVAHNVGLAAPLALFVVCLALVGTLWPFLGVRRAAIGAACVFVCGHLLWYFTSVTTVEAEETFQGLRVSHTDAVKRWSGVPLSRSSMTFDLKGEPLWFETGDLDADGARTGRWSVCDERESRWTHEWYWKGEKISEAGYRVHAHK